MESGNKSQLFENSLLLFWNFVLAIIFFFGIASNVLALLVFYRKPGLRTTANRFVINLMIINMVSCLSLLPITFADNSLATMDNYLCFAEQFLSIFCSAAIVYSVLLIAIDQYFAVVNPLHYHCIISTWKGYLMIIATWGFSAGLALLGTMQSDFGMFYSNVFQQCAAAHSDQKTSYRKDSDDSMDVSTVESNSPNLYRIIFCITYVTTAFLIPFGLICFIYYSICVAASGNTRRARTSILSNEDSHIIGKRYHNVPVESENSGNKTTLEKESDTLKKKQDSSNHDQQNESDVTQPSFVVTRPSPPKPLRGVENEDEQECKCVRKTQEKNDCRSIISKTKENSIKVKIESEVPLLKPTLKSNSSFTKLSTVHIQFSNSTEKITDKSPTGRRHSNILLSTVDPEFVNITKGRSSSMQSNFYEIPNRLSFSTRSTTTSTQIQSSRSSSIYSTSAPRLPPSRASSIRSTSSYIVHNIRHRISNASLFRYREEARAARISAMVIVMALCCWLPFFIVISTYSDVCLRRFIHFPYYLDAFSIVLLLASTVISPFLFAFRNRQIKKEVRKIFQICSYSGCTKSFYSNNFSLGLKSQTAQLLTELTKGANFKRGMTQTKPSN